LDNIDISDRLIDRPNPCKKVHEEMGKPQEEKASFNGKYGGCIHIIFSCKTNCRLFNDDFSSF
jgi:hypothetical protein